MSASEQKTKGAAVVCFPFIGDLVGGSHISAMGLISNLDRSRFEPLVVLHRMDGPLAELLLKNGVSFIKAPASDKVELRAKRNFATFYRVLRDIAPIVRFLRKHNVSIVHTNDGRVHIIWGIAARLAGAKLLWHHRSDPLSFGARYVAGWLSSCLVSVSRFAAPQPVLRAFSKTSLVVHSPFDVSIATTVDRDEARARLMAELGCAPNTRFVGYVGSLVGRKRPILFVDVVAAIRRRAPEQPVMGVLFGDVFDDLDRAVARRASDLGASDVIRYMGYRYPAEIWIAALDALLVTAVDEPFGRTLVEAMLLRTPIVAALSGGNPEAIRHNETGMLVPADDAEAFAEAALAILTSQALAANLAERARADALSRFGIARHVEDVSRLYDEVLLGYDGPRPDPGGTPPSPRRNALRVDS